MGRRKLQKLEEGYINTLVVIDETPDEKQKRKKFQLTLTT